MKKAERNAEVLEGAIRQGQAMAARLMARAEAALDVHPGPEAEARATRLVAACGRTAA